MSLDLANPSSILQIFFPLIVLAGIMKGLELAIPAKRQHRGGRSRSREDRAASDRLAQLEKLLAATPPSSNQEAKGTGEISEFKVSARRYFFSVQENQFYRTLMPIAERLGYVVFSKVKLADIVEEAKDAPRAQFNHYDRLHVDYVLVTKTDFQPVLGIELNGPSHAKGEQQYRDKKKQMVFRAAKLPLLHFYNHSFTPEEIEQKLGDALGTATSYA